PSLKIVDVFSPALRVLALETLVRGFDDRPLLSRLQFTADVSEQSRHRDPSRLCNRGQAVTNCRVDLDRRDGHTNSIPQGIPRPATLAYPSAAFGTSRNGSISPGSDAMCRSNSSIRHPDRSSILVARCGAGRQTLACPSAGLSRESTARTALPTPSPSSAGLAARWQIPYSWPGPPADPAPAGVPSVLATRDEPAGHPDHKRCSDVRSTPVQSRS